MKFVVIGGSGLIGSKLVGLLRRGDHQVIAASPSTGVNTVTGDGLAEAMEDAHVVIDVANSPSLETEVARDFFSRSGANLVAAEAAAGVRHHVALSVVGTDRLQDSGYFRAKLIQEQLIRDSGIPFTILRATQFFEFIGGIAGSSTEGQVVRLPPALLQPVAAADVAEALARISIGLPKNDIVELAGPEPFKFSDVVNRVLEAAHDERLVISDAQARYFGVAIEERTLVPDGQPWLAPTSLDAWLASNTPRV